MAITLVGTASGVVAAGGGSESPSLPGGLAENDIVVALLGSDGNISNGGIDPGEGYTEIFTTASGTPGCQVAWKRMGATPDTTITIIQIGVQQTAWAVQAWRGVDLTTVIDATLTSFVDTGPADPDPPSYTPVTNNALVICTGVIDDVDIESSITAPANYTNLVAQEAGGGAASTCTIMMASRVLAVAAAEDPATFGASEQDAVAATTFALRPAAVGAMLSLPQRRYQHMLVR